MLMMQNVVFDLISNEKSMRLKQGCGNIYLFIIYIAVYFLEFGSYMQVSIAFTAQARTVFAVVC